MNRGGAGVEREWERESLQDRNLSWRYPKSDCVDMDELPQTRNHQILPRGRGKACTVLMSYSMGSIHNLVLPKDVGPLAQSSEGFLGRIELIEEGIP